MAHPVNIGGDSVTTTVSAGVVADQPTSVAFGGFSVLQRPWADRLLAAARVQHENTRDNAQASSSDYCVCTRNVCLKQNLHWRDVTSTVFPSYRPF